MVSAVELFLLGRTGIAMGIISLRLAGQPHKATYVEKVISLLGERSILLEDGMDYLTAEESASLHPYGSIIFGASLEVRGEGYNRGLDSRARSINGRTLSERK